jgi:hypothetical protein
VQAGQQRAEAGAVGGVGRQVMLAGQAIDHGRRLALDREQQVALRIGVRPGHRQAGIGQVLHQLQVERQLLGGEPLEQGQHVASGAGVDEVVGVLDAAGAGRHVAQGADAEPVDQSRRLVEGNLGEDRHRDGVGLERQDLPDPLAGGSARVVPAFGGELRDPSPTMIS